MHCCLMTGYVVRVVAKDKSRGGFIHNTRSLFYFLKKKQVCDTTLLQNILTLIFEVAGCLVMPTAGVRAGDDICPAVATVVTP